MLEYAYLAHINPLKGNLVSFRSHYFLLGWSLYYVSQNFYPSSFFHRSVHLLCACFVVQYVSKNV